MALLNSAFANGEYSGVMVVGLLARWRGGGVLIGMEDGRWMGGFCMGTLEI